MEIVFKANTVQEYKKLLLDADFRVPERSDGRTKDDVEKYDLSHLLLCLMQCDLLTFPLELIHRNRPDFLLVMGNKSIGIEHTEAIHQNIAHKEFLMDQNNGPSTWFISPISPNDLSKSKKELMKEIQENAHGDGWWGDSPEISWKEVMLHFIQKKLSIAQKVGYEKFDENWLLIYNNWSLPSLNIYGVIPTFFQEVKNSGALKEFDRIFITKDKEFCDISSTGVTVHNVDNL
ncbi:MAG: hypothetical protein JW927_09030 [Deltaproteobacteria bacterium]|nr:hypothetical protein [Deltaproteobacteria bacterium]